MIRDVQRVTLEDFGIDPSDSDDGWLVLQLTGTGDAAAVATLNECLAAVELNVAANEVTTLELDIRKLQLLNSSCLKTFASFILRLIASKADCPIRFVVDARQPWQARSLFALERLAGDRVNIVAR